MTRLADGVLPTMGNGGWPAGMDGRQLFPVLLSDARHLHGHGRRWRRRASRA
ncbi:MAG: hypothetical protein ACLSAH_11940 [Bilophila wadsworthia]